MNEHKAKEESIIWSECNEICMHWTQKSFEQRTARKQGDVFSLLACSCRAVAAVSGNHFSCCTYDFIDHFTGNGCNVFNDLHMLGIQVVGCL